MQLGLKLITHEFNWTDDDIQLNKLLEYSKNIIEKPFVIMFNHIRPSQAVDITIQNTITLICYSNSILDMLISTEQALIY